MPYGTLPYINAFAQKVSKDAPKKRHNGELWGLSQFGLRRFHRHNPSCWNSSLLLLREHFITDFMLLPPWARAPQSPSKYEEAAQCAASFYAIRGEWTTTESHSLRFIQNARVLKSIPARRGFGGILSSRRIFAHFLYGTRKWGPARPECVQEAETNFLIMA